MVTRDWEPGLEFGHAAFQRGVLRAQVGRFAARGCRFLRECRQEDAKLVESVVVV
jgi:hypothetical protein